MTKVKDLREKDKIKQRLLIKNLSKGVTTKGAPYFNISFQDETGVIEAKKWEINEEDQSIFDLGNVLEVEGDILKYRGALQLRVLNARLISKDEVDQTDFIKTAPKGRKELRNKLFEFIEKISNKDMKLVVEEIIKENYLSFSTFPAATRNHHEYGSGLLYHTVSMLKLGEAIINLYPSLDKDLLYSGIILHDIGKTKELSGPIVPKYTTEGKLLGHISIIQAEIAKVSQKFNITSQAPILLQHMVLSHHGKKEFGSPVEPMIKEAEILAFIDNIDSRIDVMEKALEKVKEGDFTPRIFALEDRSLYKPIKEK